MTEMMTERMELLTDPSSRGSTMNYQNSGRLQHVNEDQCMPSDIGFDKCLPQTLFNDEKGDEDDRSVILTNLELANLTDVANLSDLDDTDWNLEDQQVVWTDSRNVATVSFEDQFNEILDYKDAAIMSSHHERIAENALQEKRDKEVLDMPAYKMDASPRGLCIILNNEIFTHDQHDPRSQKLNDRAGTRKDADSLTLLFNSLGFTVQTADNLTNLEMVKICRQIALVNHSKFDCFICCILSHGLRDCVYGTNGQLVRIEDLTAPFKSCSTLRGKPKLFIIQACQGFKYEEGYNIEADSPYDIEADSPDQDHQQVSVPYEADCLIAHSTAPGYASFRNTQHGSWYIRKLVEFMYQYSDEYDLLSILTRVNEEVNKEVTSGNGKRFRQSPAPMSLLTKRVYLRKHTVRNHGNMPSLDDLLGCKELTKDVESTIFIPEPINIGDTHLWKFILSKLDGPRNEMTLLQWRNRDCGIFEFIDCNEFSRLWGLTKGKTDMNFAKLSRAIRYYYEKGNGIIEAVRGRKRCYMFNWKEVMKRLGSDHTQ